MKQFVFGLCAAFALTLGPVRVASAQSRWRHTGPGPMGAGAAGADNYFQWPNWPKPHIRRSHGHLEKPTPLYTSPKSVGWWHKGPGPMGAGAAGADKYFQWPTWPKLHIGGQHYEKPTALYTSPKSVGWWRKGPGPKGAGSGN
jgi:hypothetical protein